MFQFEYWPVAASVDDASVFYVNLDIYDIQFSLYIYIEKHSI